MPSILEQNVEALMATLVGTEDVDDRIFRERTAALHRDELPAIVVKPMTEPMVQENMPIMIWRAIVRVEILVRGDEPSKVADSIKMSVFSKLMANRDLGGIAHDLTPNGTSYEYDEADGSLALIAMDFALQYQTSGTDLGAQI